MVAWEVRPLGEVLKLDYGKPLPTEDRIDEGEFPAYGANGVKCRTNKYYSDKRSIIVGRKGSAGELTLTTEKFWPLDVTYFVTFDNRKYDLQFLFHALKSLHLPKLAKGVKPGINRNDIYKITFPFPPLSEQKRIVSVLDEAFEGIDAVISNAAKNRANAVELSESYLNSVLLDLVTQPTSQTLTSVTELIVDCEHKTAPTQEKGIPSIRTPNIGNGKLLLSAVNRVSEETYKMWTKRAQPRPGDLILAREAPAGNVGVIPPGEKVCLGQRTVLIRPKKNINSEFLAFLILHRVVQDRLLTQAKGATVQHVNMKDIRRLPLSELPALHEQTRLAAQITGSFIETERLEAIYEQKLGNLAKLKQSIMQKAFSGELTSTNKSEDAAA